MLRFFQPERLSDLRLAQEELDRRSAGDTAAVWHDAQRGARGKWSTLRLPRPLMHPAAPRLWAEAAGASAEAIHALEQTDAFLADDGTLTQWPWYREEDALMRPLAEAESARSGLAIPRDLLDEPFDPSYYLSRSGKDALRALLASRGVTDAAAGFVDRVPVPPRDEWKPVAYEGGLTADPIAAQRFQGLLRWVARAPHVEEEHLAELDAMIANALGAVVAAMGGERPREPNAPRPVELPAPREEIPAVGQVISVWAVLGGALLQTEGRIISLGEDGSFQWAIVAHDRIEFATGHGASLDGHVLDLQRRAFRSGDYAALAAELGLPDVADAEGSYRHTPARSACGLYALDTDETPFIQRLADRALVASGQALDRLSGEPSRGRGLLRAEDLEVGTTVTIDGVRFTLRNDKPCSMEGRSPIALALARKDAGERGNWRIFGEGTVRQGRRVLARLGVPAQGAAFTADGARLWVLLPDHLARIDLDGPRASVAVKVPLSPILNAAEAP
jgi:hypothetical protein